MRIDMTIPKWVRLLMLATAAIPVGLIVIEVLRFGAFPLIFAVVVGAPVIFLSRRRGRRMVERDEQRWAAWEARNRRGSPRR